MTTEEMATEETSEVEERNLSQWQGKIASLVEENGWNQNLFETYFLFHEEIGELTKAIRRTKKFHLEVTGDNNNIGQERENLEEEFADVAMYLFDLANQFEVNLNKAIEQKIRKNESRSWE